MIEKLLIKGIFLFILILFINIKNNYNKFITKKNNYTKYSLNLKHKIRIGIVSNSIKNGGAERQTTLLLHYFNNITIFELYLFTKKDIQENEYTIEKKIKRIPIKSDLIDYLNLFKIDILIYQIYDLAEMEMLNNYNKTKTIFINRSCFLHWIYYKLYYQYKILYRLYQKSKYIVSLIHFENDYLFEKWGIKSILMNNFIPYEYNSILPSNLSSKTILMIGRGSDETKRFILGIESMKYIIKEIPECEMKIISELDIEDLFNYVHQSNLTDKINFVGYKSNPEEYYINASLHIFPTLVEAFPNVLSESLVYGIPTILAGLDYVSTAKGGTVIIYDDSPLSIAKIAIKILKDKVYRQKLGKEARENIKQFNNELLLKKWINLIISIYKGDNYYEILRNNENKISKNEYLKIIENQINLLKLRNNTFNNITIQDIENFTFIENLGNLN